MDGIFALMLLAVGFNLLIIVLAISNEIAKRTIFRIPAIRRWLYEEEPVHNRR